MFDDYFTPLRLFIIVQMLLNVIMVYGIGKLILEINRQRELLAELAKIVQKLA